MTKNIVFLCKNCIKDLEQYNPYVGPIKIKEVSLEKCDNYTDEKGYFTNLRRNRKNQNCY